MTLKKRVYRTVMPFVPYVGARSLIEIKLSRTSNRARWKVPIKANATGEKQRARQQLGRDADERGHRLTARGMPAAGFRELRRVSVDSDCGFYTAYSRMLVSGIVTSLASLLFA
ncbi:hypothetical protein EVAR_94443_1 [Eumeta japonica]|uniref:Uncharacterized protein n=1 Tax=Eumeta variegata TaxID=151549 RepID=A0A4C1TQ78_EUMVA|nr:hypothetical protein EVAR_94443_1 [Eumeta japonica]